MHHDSFLIKLSRYKNYYRNLTAEDIQQAVPLHHYFNNFYFEYNDKSKDLYFYGVRNHVTFEWSQCEPENRNILTLVTQQPSFLGKYGDMMAKYISPFRYQVATKYLQIGIMNESYPRLMREYLVNAQHLVFYDKNPSIVNKITHQLDKIIGASNIDLETFKMFGPFDVIIQCESDGLKMITSLLPLMEEKGIFVILDPSIKDKVGVVEMQESNTLIKEIIICKDWIGFIRK
jgi:hypothetical protein